MFLGTDPPSTANFLKKEDFVLVLQTEHQKQLAQKFGPSGICCDSTHGTNAYNFTLTSIVVKDEFAEGQPVAWCISNHESYPFMKLFFEKVKENTGLIQPPWFMSDLGIYKYIYFFYFL